MVYADIKSLFQEMTGDSGALWTDSQLFAWANEAQGMALRRSGALEKRQTVLGVAEQAEYDLPTDCDRVYRVAYDGEALKPVLRAVLRSSNPEFSDISGTPFMYYLDEINRKFGLYYKPSAATTVVAEFEAEWGVVLEPAAGGTASQEWGIVIDPLDVGQNYSQEWGDLVSAVSGLDIEVFYDALPPAIDSGDDVPALPHWAHGVILFWMLKRAYEADTAVQDFVTAQFWEEMAEKVFERLSARSKSKLNKVWQLQSGGDVVGGPTIRDRYPDTIGAGEDTHA